MVSLPWYLFAQTRIDTSSTKSRTPSTAISYLELGYSGATIFHPGITCSFSKPIFFKTNQEKNSLSEIQLGLQAGIYYHKNMHTGLYIGPVAKWIKTSSKGFEYGFNLELGYLRTFISDVYEITGSGEIKHIQLAGTNHFTIFPSFRLGHRFKNESFINGWFINNGLMVIMPYAGNMTSQYFIEAGIVKRFK